MRPIKVMQPEVAPQYNRRVVSPHYAILSRLVILLGSLGAVTFTVFKKRNESDYGGKRLDSII